MIHSMIKIIPAPCPHRGFRYLLIFQARLRPMLQQLSRSPGATPEYTHVESERLIHEARKQFETKPH